MYTDKCFSPLVLFVIVVCYYISTADDVGRITSLGRLIQPSLLVYDLALLSDGTSHRYVCGAFLVDQYR